jgi:hypothetical protein
MTDSLSEWLERHAEREEAESRQVLSTAKLVTTFSAAMAAAFLAMALQLGRVGLCWADWLAVWGMLVLLVLTLWIITLGRKSSVAKNELLKARQSATQVEPQMLHELRAKFLDAASDNSGRALLVHRMMIVQVLLAIAISVIAVYSVIQLLRGAPC